MPVPIPPDSLIQNSLAVEVVLVTENTTDWNDRLRFQIPANASATEMNVLLINSLTLGQKYNNEKSKGLCFRYRELSSFQSFAVSVSQLTFKMQAH
jgi:hypothetical protein